MLSPNFEDQRMRCGSKTLLQVRKVFFRQGIVRDIEKAEMTLGSAKGGRQLDIDMSEFISDIRKECRLLMMQSRWDLGKLISENYWKRSFRSSLHRLRLSEQTVGGHGVKAETYEIACKAGRHQFTSGSKFMLLHVARLIMAQNGL